MKNLQKEAFANGFVGSLRRAAQDVASTRSARRGLIDQTRGSWSMIGNMLGAGEEHNIVGAKTINNMAQKGRRAVSDADTYLGSLAAGKNWENGTGFRKTMFTDSKDNYLKGSDDRYTKVKVPSISAPIKGAAPILTGMWAMNEGYRQVDSLRGKNRELQ